MQFDVNIFVFLVLLNVGMALAFALYGSRLLNYRRLAGVTHANVESSFSGLQVALRVPRPVKRYYVPRMRTKSDSSGDEPPHISL